MDFGNPRKVRFCTNCVLLGSEAIGGEGGEGVVTDFATNAMNTKYLLEKSDRYTYVRTYYPNKSQNLLACE